FRDVVPCAGPAGEGGSTGLAASLRPRSPSLCKGGGGPTPDCASGPETGWSGVWPFELDMQLSFQGKTLPPPGGGGGRGNKTRSFRAQGLSPRRKRYTSNGRLDLPTTGHRLSPVLDHGASGWCNGAARYSVWSRGRTDRDQSCTGAQGGANCGRVCPVRVDGR